MTTNIDTDDETALIAGLRSKLAAVTTERDDLRAALTFEAEQAISSDEPRSAAFWMAAWKERNRQLAESALRYAMDIDEAKLSVAAAQDALQRVATACGLPPAAPVGDIVAAIRRQR